MRRHLRGRRVGSTTSFGNEQAMKTPLITLALGAAIVAAAASTNVANASKDSDSDLLRDVRAATARYHSPARAQQDGYVRDSPCETSPAGAMGYHYVNFALLEDPAIAPLRPEILLYAPRSNGTVRLVGVEYLKIDQDGLLTTDDDRPYLGDVAFDGPMPGHGPHMPVHYDLHVWLYKANPSGMYAAWNPAVTC